ncbi:SDR family oxidoreductase [Alloalcanivorax gelatiniphagus]
MRIAVAGGTGLFGSQVVAKGIERGYRMLPISRDSGHNLTAAGAQARLKSAIYGADAVIDVTRSPSSNEREATVFFEAAGTNLANATASVGVERTVVLSLIGADSADGPDADPRLDSYDGYLRAKGRQERAAVSRGHGVHVVRAAQSHNFVGQVLSRSQNEAQAVVDDLVVQPVEVSLVVDVLLDVAAAQRHDALLEVAGPSRERLVALAKEFAAYYFDETKIVARVASRRLASGILLPRERAIVGGASFRDWLHQHARN